MSLQLSPDHLVEQGASTRDARIGDLPGDLTVPAGACDEPRLPQAGQVLREIRRADAQGRHEFGRRALAAADRVEDLVPDGVSEGREQSCVKSKSFTVPVHEGGVAVFMNF